MYRELLQEVIDRTGYVKELEAEGTEEARARIENIDELINKAASYEEDAQEPSLEGFLSEVALVADIDSMDDDAGRVILMTLHSAKGLEFPQVYLTGMEDGLFPSYMSVDSEDPDALEEERRLCYVGITRAMQDLTLTHAKKAYDARRNTLQPSVQVSKRTSGRAVEKRETGRAKGAGAEAACSDLFHAGKEHFSDKGL